MVDWNVPVLLTDDLKLSREHSEYHYLNQSDCVTADTQDDKKDFQEVTVSHPYSPLCSILHVTSDSV